MGPLPILPRVAYRVVYGPAGGRRRRRAARATPRRGRLRWAEFGENRAGRTSLPLIVHHRHHRGANGPLVSTSRLCR